MDMKRLGKYMILSVTAAALLAGCTGKFENYNTNPYGPTDGDMKGDNVETGVLIQSMTPAIVQGGQNDSQMIDQMIGLEYGGHAAMIQPWQGTNFQTYNPAIGWVGAPFTTIMPQIYTNYFKIKEKTEGKGVVYSWAQIIRVAASIKVSDCYGPIPYSKVTGSEYTVAYDSMEELYIAMFKDLTAAIETLKGAVAANADFSSLKDFDYIYQGDFNKWVKYANSLKLRMAIRIANAPMTKGDANLAQKMAEEAVSDATGVMTTVGDAAYSTFSDGMNPFYRAEYTWNNGGEFRASANITSYMEGYNDPRKTIYFDKDSRSGYRGVRNGIDMNQSKRATCLNYSRIRLQEGEPLLVMSASEVCFLRAEGALRGWNMGGQTAQQYYEQGIRVSMEEKKATLGNYLSSTAHPADYADYEQSYKYSAMSTVSPKWDTAAGFEENLERIIIQKWIATYPSGWETWADIRRTGYPKFFPIVDNKSNSTVSSSRGMRRLPFPESEKNTNTANVEAAVAMLEGSDTAATDLWWAKKD